MKNLRIILPLLAIALVALFSGCATTEEDNLSERPWNAPKSWENGMPGMTPYQR